MFRPANTLQTQTSKEQKNMAPVSPQMAPEIEMSAQKQREGEKLINLENKENKGKMASTVQQLLDQGENDTGGVEDGKITKAYFAKFLRLEQCCCILTVIAGGISVLEYDLEFNEIHEEIALILLWVIFIATLTTLVMTVLRYQSYLKYLQVRRDISQKDTLFSNQYLFIIINSNWVPLVIELIILSVIPYPWTWKIRSYFYNQVQGQEAYYHVNEILTLIMILRIIFVVRTILIQTIWYSNRTQRVCNLYACEANYMFVIKSLMRSQPYQVIFTVMFAMIFLFGYALRICESPLARNDSSSNNLSLYANDMWNIIITMTTVGYGDFYARTDLGRLIIFMVCIFGVFVVSMMVVTLTNSLMATSLEGKAITVLERLQVRDELIGLAATVITLTAKISLGWRLQTITRKQHLNLLLRLRKAMNDFKVTQRLYKSIQNTGSINEEMTREFDLVRSHFKEMMERQQKLLQINDEILANIKGGSNIPEENKLESSQVKTSTSKNES